MEKQIRTLIAGAGEAGQMVFREITQNNLGRNVVGFLDDDPDKQNQSIGKFEIKVLGGTNDVVSICNKYQVDEVIIAMPSENRDVIKPLIEKIKKTAVDLKIVPGIREIIEGDVKWNQVRNVKPVDLLGRETVEVDENKLRNFFNQKTVLVTGAAGSIGSGLVKKLLEFPVESVTGLDCNESGLYDLEISKPVKSNSEKFNSHLSNIRDRTPLENLFRNTSPDVVLHAAALKHVPMCEKFPEEAIRTNVIGTFNIFNKCLKHEVEDCVLISTDKTVNPENIMGKTKNICEKLVGSFQKKASDTRFAGVRFGNILGSRSSVVPIFENQIKNGGPVTVTDPDIERIFMTPNEAVNLVLMATSLGEERSIYILKVEKSLKIIDLARELISLHGYEPETEIPIEITGLREGESMREKLIAEEETPEPTKNPKILRCEADTLSEYQWNKLLKITEDEEDFKTSILEEIL